MVCIVQLRQEVKVQEEMEAVRRHKVNLPIESPCRDIMDFRLLPNNLDTFRFYGRVVGLSRGFTNYSTQYASLKAEDSCR